jgi:hypothetical protein
MDFKMSLLICSNTVPITRREACRLTEELIISPFGLKFSTRFKHAFRPSSIIEETRQINPGKENDKARFSQHP